MDHSELLSLPEDDLLAVLSYLSAEELLHCRQVCRRLRDVCLHPSLWRSVRLLFYDEMKAVALRALRLAPCLRKIVLHPVDLDALQAVYTSSCVIEGLSMNVAEPSDVPRAMGILQRVSSVGALRELDMNIDCTTSLEIEPLLYLILCSLNDLRKLAFWNTLPTGFSRLVAIKPSLTSLTYTSFNDNESYTFLATLLKGHAATLTSVELDVVQDIPVSLLKDIPNLKSLACPPMDALSDLHSARFLETLDLAWPVDDEFPPGALEFLRTAPQLRHVSISFPQENSAAPLLSLSESPSAVCVETLSLRGHWPDGCLEQVAAALHHFPSLRTLDVATVATSSLIRAVDPASTPRLTELKSLTPARVCVHNWLHGPVQDLLTRNPNLHLRVASIDGVVNAKECTCVWCDWGCHPELKRSISFAFSSHRRTRSCPADCFRLVI